MSSGATVGGCKIMNAEAVRSLVTILISSKPTVKQVTDIVGPGQLKPLPPNQFEFSTLGNSSERVEIVLSKDNDPSAPIAQVNVILGERCGLTLKQLVQWFGATETVEEDRPKPAPAELLRFSDISRPHDGLDLQVYARVSRPVSPESLVRSVQFVRSMYTPKR